MRAKKIDKKIGVVTQVLGMKSLGLLFSYYKYLSNFGEVIMLHNNSSIIEDLDLLVLIGGPDIDQSLYKDKDDSYEYRVNNPPSARGFFYSTILPEYIKIRTPMFGICLGHQVLAVTLAQGFLESDMIFTHKTNDKDEPWALTHQIKLTLPYELMSKLDFNLIIGKKIKQILDVNSRHHQIVDSVNKDLATPIAHWYDKKISNLEKFKYYKPIEALMYNEYPAYSVQWHPEDIEDDLSKLLINDLLENN